MFSADEFLILLCAFLTTMAGHWFPWRIFRPFLDQHGQLRKVPAYVYGVSTLLAGMCGWSYFHGDWRPTLFLLALSVAAGLGTVFPRFLERELEGQATREDVEGLWHALDEHKTQK